MQLEPDRPQKGHQRHLRAGRISEPFATYAVTKCVECRRPVLATNATADIIIDCFDYLRSRAQIKLLAFCVMPDHYHGLFLLLRGQNLSQIMSSIGKFTASRINKLTDVGGQFWQDGFFDHQCRGIDDVLDRIAYIERNPVRAGLAADAADWPYSSAYPANGRLLDRKWYAERC
jgi:REP element-mobilizing transposase RayT